MEHHFICPKVEEIVDVRPAPTSPRPPSASQRELVLASLLRRPENASG